MTFDLTFCPSLPISFFLLSGSALLLHLLRLQRGQAAPHGLHQGRGLRGQTRWGAAHPAIEPRATRGARALHRARAYRVWRRLAGGPDGHSHCGPGLGERHWPGVLQGASARAGEGQRCAAPGAASLRGITLDGQVYGGSVRKEERKGKGWVRMEIIAFSSFSLFSLRNTDDQDLSPLFHKLLTSAAAAVSQRMPNAALLPFSPLHHSPEKAPARPTRLSTAPTKTSNEASFFR